MNRNYLKLAFLPALVGCMLSLNAQDRRTPPTTPPTNGGTQQPPTNGGNRPTPPAQSKGPKPYKEVITEKTKTQKGLFKVHFFRG